MPAEEQQPLIRGLRVDPKTGKYRVDISIAGHRVQIATRTSDREEAEAMLEKIRRRLWGHAVLGEEPAITWAELEPEYLRKLEAKGNRTVDNTRIKLDWLRPHLGHLTLPEITSTVIAQVLEQRRQEGKALKLRKGEQAPRVVPLQPATLNRYWAVISGMLHLALRTSRISAIPVWDGKVPEPRGRAKVIRWLTHEQADRLHDELPEHIKPMYRFALATGLRKANVCTLEWDQIDLGRRLVHIS
ncbi:MAG: tyrosine-type recombinase/integrase, partial [Burkholderiales bacterium]|nr:tyrosine-type recombinase/integrase [Burkholderiales bacterium]